MSADRQHRQAAVEIDSARQAARARGRSEPERPAEGAGGGTAGGEPPGYPYGAYSATNVEFNGASGMLDLRVLLSILRRRKWLILGLVVLAVVGASLYVAQLTPLYRAEAVIAVAPDRTKVLDVDQVVGDLPGDFLTLQTEAARIASRAVALRAVDRLNLVADARFNPNLPRPADADSGFSLSGLLNEGLVLIGLREPAPPPPETPPVVIADPALLREHMASRFMGGLSVFNGERSRLINVQYVSADPQFAALAANAVTLSYIEGQLENIGGETTRAEGVVQEKVAALEQELVAAERRLESFRAEHGLTTVGDASLQAQQLTNLNGDLVQARNRLTEQLVRYQQVEGMLKNGGSVESAAAVMDASLIQSLRLQEIEVNREIAEYATKYRESHPTMIEARARQKEIQAKIWSEIRRTASMLKNEVDIAQGQVANLEA